MEKRKIPHPNRGRGILYCFGYIFDESIQHIDNRFHYIIRFCKIDSRDLVEYSLSGDKLEVLDILLGYTHSIENTGRMEMVTVMWANECFNPEEPDTFYDGV